MSNRRVLYCPRCLACASVTSKGTRLVCVLCRTEMKEKPARIKRFYGSEEK